MSGFLIGACAFMSVFVTVSRVTGRASLPVKKRTPVIPEVLFVNMAQTETH